MHEWNGEGSQGRFFVDAAIDGGRMDIEGPCDLADGLSIFNKLSGCITLPGLLVEIDVIALAG